MTRVFAIGLDGYEPAVGDELMAAGAMPNLAGLRDQSACFLLDHGSARRTGLAWEHVSSGMSPSAANRWSAVHFDKDTYRVEQEGARLSPFLNFVDARAVIFDLPYFRLEQAPRVHGLTAWGAHDPGVPPSSRPEPLLAEARERFGEYPATEWIYGFAWPSVDRCRAMGKALTEATDLRARVARWLFTDRLPEWDIGMTVVSELHSAAEGLWHGIDPAHPLSDHPSAPVARDGVLSVYRAVDRLIGDLAEAMPDATLVVFSMHGMGINHSDVASMVLLPDLLFRHAYGRSAIAGPDWSAGADRRVPLLEPDASWNVEIRPPSPGLAQRIRRRLGLSRPDHAGQGSLDWMPAARYQPYWKAMPAFALPSFYDGQVRINLQGREAAGCVPLSQFGKVRDEIAHLLHACRNPLTSEPVVESIDYHEHCPPMDIDSSAADIVVEWRGSVLAFEHPELGMVGPVPFRRPGGHTGGQGAAWIRGAGIPAADHGVRSAFDIVPTLIDLAGHEPVHGLSGSSLLGVTRAGIDAVS